MRRLMVDRTTIAILAKAPLPGLAKTRLIPELGADGAAALQARLIERAVETACAAKVGPVVLWCAPDETDPLFQAMGRTSDVTLARQPDGDLGARMFAAVKAAPGPVLVMGTDCPAITPDELRIVAEVLHSYDAGLIPAEDGGYVLLGLRKPQPVLFSDIAWGTSSVGAETRWLMSAHGLTWRELPPLWDVDRPEDIERLRREGFASLLG
jgi:rSAM/selenodomain-associated transferase 1